MNTVSERIKWRRILWLVLCFMCLFAVLMGRLFVLMTFPVFAGPSIHGIRHWTALRSHGDMEHFDTFLTNNGRGRLLFRSGAPMSMTENMQSVVGITGKPDAWPRVGEEVPVAGRSGLELVFDSVLQGTHAGYAGILERDRRNEKYFTVDAKSGADIRTTLDFFWQRASETALNRARVEEGAVVVLNVRTNEVLAMAQRSTKPLTNNAVLPFAPGSVFKLVVAAAALDAHRISRSIHFFCHGRLDTSMIHLACWRTHGEESLREAIIQSCDIAFANIGVMLGRYPIETMFHQIGLDTNGLQRVEGKSILPEARAGHVFEHRGNDEGLLANTAIGQEDVQISPLQGALLASAIANHGLVRSATMVVDAEKNGKMVRSYIGGRSFHRAFSGGTASFLNSAMQGVVENADGTFHDLNHLPISVKTGTAELPDKRFVNAWVIGYMHREHPEIAFAVLSSHVSSAVGHKQVRQIVRDLVDSYMQIQGESLIR